MNRLWALMQEFLVDSSRRDVGIEMDFLLSLRHSLEKWRAWIEAKMLASSACHLLAIILNESTKKGFGRG